MTLDDLYVERGTRIRTDDHECQIGIFKLDDDQWLWAQVIPDNYPAWTIFTMRATPAEVIAKIEKDCDGWYCEDSHLEGLGMGPIGTD